jgi:threonine/homoserine/homoserine lactone efflux protein
MPHDLLLALILYAFVSSITPGPNNLMLLASGVNFGFRRTIPHMLGIGGGFTVMVLVVGLGLAGLFLAYPPARMVLTLVSVVYLLWLAWKIANAAPPDKTPDAAGQPFGFLQAAGFQ